MSWLNMIKPLSFIYMKNMICKTFPEAACLLKLMYARDWSYAKWLPIVVKCSVNYHFYYIRKKIVSMRWVKSWQNSHSCSELISVHFLPMNSWECKRVEEKYIPPWMPLRMVWLSLTFMELGITNKDLCWFN